MSVTLSADERLLVDRVIEFANATPVPAPEAVEALFRGLPQVPGVWQTIAHEGEKARRAFERKDQADLRRWLAAVASGNAIDREAAEREVLRDLRAAVLGELRVRFEGGRLRIERAFRFTGVRGALALGAALLLDEASGLTGRLYQCGAGPGICERFNLTWLGKPRRHCSPGHAALADARTWAKRQQDYRERKKKRQQARAPTRGK